MSDGQFSSKPIRSGRSRDSAITASPADAGLSAGAATAFLQSPGVQREIDALLERPFPPVGEVSCPPLHPKTPTDARELGTPVASATLVQEYLIGLIFLRVAGWIFLAFGVLFLLGAISMSIVSVVGRNAPADPWAALVGMTVVGLAVGGAGAWFGIFRSRVINEMCWFCPRGMIWRTESYFEWYTWEEVPELFCRLRAPRPAIGISFDDNNIIAWISFSNTPASRRILAYLEKRASAACTPTTLRAIAQGSAVRFGAWRLSRSTIRDPDADFAWKDLIDVAVDERELHVRHRERGNKIIPLDEVPFPSLFTALARGIYAHSREGPLAA